MADECLLGIFQKLGAEDFKSFQWHLKKDPNGNIPTYMLENATREKTVDLIVQVCPYTAVEVTKNLLEKINRPDLVAKLSGAGSGCNGN